eukprot:8540184-Prorocentrum_lima.AAC.1
MKQNPSPEGAATQKWQAANPQSVGKHTDETEAAYSKAELLNARAQTPCGKDHKESSALQTIPAQPQEGGAGTLVVGETASTMDTPCTA